MTVETRYLDGTYLAHNPEWDCSDAPWKAARVAEILKRNGISPTSICDVGCGSGHILAELRGQFPDARLYGFDISPQLRDVWRKHAALGIDLRVGNFLESTERYDVLTMLDVFEHVRDPFSFLEAARGRAGHFVFHIPLDLSALSVARGTPLMQQRRNVGHLHFYTKDLALETLQDCGYSTIEWCYTEAYASLVTHRTWKTRLAHMPRRLLASINRDAAARLLGGETLIVLATART